MKILRYESNVYASTLPYLTYPFHLWRYLPIQFSSNRGNNGLNVPPLRELCRKLLSGMDTHAGCLHSIPFPFPLHSKSLLWELNHSTKSFRNESNNCRAPATTVCGPPSGLNYDDDDDGDDDDDDDG